MARFSPGFLTGLGNPAMLQDFRAMGAALGNVPTQYAESEKRKALAGYDPSTPEGQIELLAAQIQQETDPTKRLVLGQQLQEVKKAQVEKSRLDAVTRSTEGLAAAVETGGDPLTANLIRTGAITPTGGLNAKRQMEVVSKGVNARRSLAKNLGVEMPEDSFEQYTDAQFNALITVKQEKNKRSEVAKKLRERGKDQIAKDFEDGLYTESQVGQLLQKSNQPSYSNRDRKLVDGELAWTADVTGADGKKFVGTLRNGEWVPVSAESVKDIPSTSTRVNSVSNVEMDQAGILMAELPEYKELGSTGKAQAQLKLALLANRLVDEGKADSMDEAMTTAMQVFDFRGIDEGKNGWDAFFSWFERSSEPPAEASPRSGKRLYNPATGKLEDFSE